MQSAPIQTPRLPSTPAPYRHQLPTPSTWHLRDHLCVAPVRPQNSRSLDQSVLCLWILQSPQCNLSSSVDCWQLQPRPLSCVRWPAVSIAPFLLVRMEVSAPPDPASPTSAGAQAAIVFIKEPSSQDALQGRRALLRCEVEAPGPVEVHWLLNGVPVQDTERRFAQGSSLSFAAVDRLQDSGAFQCVARDNITGEEARSANASFNIKCERSFRGRVPCLCTRQTRQLSPGSLVSQFLLLSFKWDRKGLAVVLLAWRRGTCLPPSLLIFFRLSIFCFPTLPSPLRPPSPSLPLSLLCAGPRVPHIPAFPTTASSSIYLPEAFTDVLGM